MALAVMFANVFTVMFLYGLARATKIYRDEDIDGATFFCLIAPLAFFGGGLLIYG